MEINIPLQGKQVEDLPRGLNLTEYPNRRMRRYHLNSIPNSTKLGKGSLQKGTVYRTNKYNGNH